MKRQRRLMGLMRLYPMPRARRTMLMNYIYMVLKTIYQSKLIVCVVKMLTFKEAEDIAGKKYLKGHIYDTRSYDYKTESFNKKHIEKKSMSILNELLHKATELRLKYQNMDVITIPFDFFVENENDSYFVEIKTSGNKYYKIADTQTFGIASANKLDIPVYILWFRLENKKNNHNIPKFELLRININLPKNKGYLDYLPMDHIEEYSCERDICTKVIKKDFHDLIINFN